MYQRCRKTIGSHDSCNDQSICHSFLSCIIDILCATAIPNPNLRCTRSSDHCCHHRIIARRLEGSHLHLGCHHQIIIRSLPGAVIRSSAHCQAAGNHQIIARRLEGSHLDLEGRSHLHLQGRSHLHQLIVSAVLLIASCVVFPRQPRASVV